MGVWRVGVRGGLDLVNSGKFSIKKDKVLCLIFGPERAKVHS